MIYSIEIKGKVIGKQRARILRSGRSYTPFETKEYEKNIQVEFKKKYPLHTLIENPIRMYIKYYIKVPPSYSVKKKNNIIENKILPMCKPDIDNVFKIVADALNRVAYLDDSQIVTAYLEKYYTNDEPKIEIEFIEYLHNGL